jgi:hypothetical protein
MLLRALFPPRPARCVPPRRYTPSTALQRRAAEAKRNAEARARYELKRAACEYAALHGYDAHTVMITEEPIDVRV